jgi:hypothetical protein
VKISARTPDAGLGIEIIVSDTGTGISREDLDRLGKPSSRWKMPKPAPRKAPAWGWRWSSRWPRCMGGSAVIELRAGRCTTVTVRLPHAAVDAKGERVTSGKVLAVQGGVLIRRGSLA